jgi:hypothetical protein
MTAVSAAESSLSSKRSWNLKAELSSIYLNAGGAESALGPTSRQLRRPRKKKAAAKKFKGVRREKKRAR